jgi:hypothetical protein
MEDSGQATNDEVFLRDAIKIVKEDKRRNVTLRLLGALAVRIQSQEYDHLHRKL